MTIHTLDSFFVVVKEGKFVDTNNKKDAENKRRVFFVCKDVK